MSRSATGWILGAILATHVALLVWIATTTSPTWDEPAHLVAGLSHWEHGDFTLYSVNPPLVRMVATAPVYWLMRPQVDWSAYMANSALRTEVPIGRRFIEQHGIGSMKYFVLARWTCILFSVLCATIIFLWTNEAIGTPSALASTALWCFSPTILAHGSLMTPDIGGAAGLITACFALSRWTRRPSRRSAFCVGICAAFAVLCKTTNIVVFPLAIACMAKSKWGASSGDPVRRPQYLEHTGIVLATALVLINAAYGFQGTGRRLGEYDFVSKALAGKQESSGNRFSNTIWGAVPVPLPQPFLAGIDVQTRDFERGQYLPGYQSYLFGEWRQGGWPHYYLCAFLCKETLGVVALLLLVTPQLLKGSNRGIASMFAWPCLAILILVSGKWSFTMHYRYVIGCLPFVFMLASFGARHSSPRWLRVSTWGLLSMSLIEGAGSVQNPLAFVNLGVTCVARSTPPLVDSNIDWGQDLLRLREWMKAHPSDGNFRFAYFGSFDPKYFGIEHSLPQPLPADAVRRPKPSQERLGPTPGVHAVSINHKMGCLMPVPNGEGGLLYFGEAVYSYFQDFQPIERIGGSIEIFDLDIETVNAWRRRHGLAEIGDAAADVPNETVSPTETVF